LLNNQEIISNNYFNIAVQQSIDNSDHSIRNAYQKAISENSRSSQFATVLLACALATTDKDNSFSIAGVLHQYNQITSNENQVSSIFDSLGMLCKSERAEILTKIGKQKNARYRFRKPLLKAYVKMKMYHPVLG
jgi:hypothetical protein